MFSGAVPSLSTQDSTDSNLFLHFSLVWRCGLGMRTKACGMTTSLDGICISHITCQELDHLR